ncbi:retrovirus-related Pol polyprotein from transposon 17.6 [Trichonephila clavipes]|nr:retrovirus-related Pol polyprotein from transposon 17.6 [Trichonephila clavipes]
MAYLAKGRRQDLLELAETLDISIPDNFKVLNIKDAILKSEGYDVDFTKECLNRIISDRKELALRAQRDRGNQRIFELQTPICRNLFERQLTFLKLPVPQWVVYLVCLLPTVVSNLIAKESVVDAQDYYKVKQILLKHFKLSTEKFRQMFSRHAKDPVKTWRDFHFDLQTYFDGWLKESKVTTLEELKNLIVADQIKKKALQDYKDHFLEQWCNWNNPLQLVGFLSQSRRETGVPSKSRRIPTSNDRIPEKKIVDTKEDRTPLSCYGCGAPESFDQGATLATQFGKKIPCHQWYWDRTRDKASHDPIPIPLGYRGLLTAAGIVLDLQRKQWYFTETSHRKYNFVKAPPNINALLTVDTKPHPCQLQENEGTHLSLTERKEINSLLEKYEECFQPGGEPTPIIEHRINTRDHLPAAVLPYRMNPSKKEILKSEINRLLAEGIIEECESPYASPVVLILKPNGTFRLCIDFRKLNEITVADTYPLPRMDDLLHQAKLTPFMSTLDLRAGYIVKLKCMLKIKTRQHLYVLLALTVTYGCHMKKVQWQWELDQQNAFQTLKNCLTTPPVLKQADSTQPYIIRTDASNYALGAVLLQGEGSDEHPIEYASRLLTPAERNYSTTERDALAVVWALKKFRGYIEGTEITVTSDHQPLKWLLNLKSPTG